MKRGLLLSCIFLLTLLVHETFHTAQAEEKTFFVDAVVASVNGKPITLTDVVKRAGVQFPSSLSEAAKDERIQYTLQEVITEKLLQEEAQERHIGVSNDEVDRYIQRIAEQNGMTIDEFGRALTKERKTLLQYRQQIEIDILRTKLASTLMREGITVGKQEVDSFIAEHPEYEAQGAKLKLRQIVLQKQGKTKDEATTKLQDLRSSLSSLKDFEKAAREFSEGPEALEGGLLGVLSEENLSGPIFDALFKLPKHGISDVIETGSGYHIFFIEDRFVGNNDESDQEKFRNEIRAELEKQKMDEKLRLYFAQELTTKFAVDKKI